MNDGFSVLQWIHQNGYTVESMAERTGYSRSSLSHALNNECISVRMDETLYKVCKLQVVPTIRAPW